MNTPGLPLRRRPPCRFLDGSERASKERKEDDERHRVSLRKRKIFIKNTFKSSAFLKKEGKWKEKESLG